MPFRDSVRNGNDENRRESEENTVAFADHVFPRVSTNRRDNQGCVSKVPSGEVQGEVLKTLPWGRIAKHLLQNQDAQVI
jgi:hypothetical protein